MNKYQDALDKLRTHCLASPTHAMGEEFGFGADYDLNHDGYEDETDVLQELVDKATPLKVSNIGSNVLDGDLQSTGTCPNCKKELYISQDDWYRFIAQYTLDEEVYIRCNHCGKALDWGEDE